MKPNVSALPFLPLLAFLLFASCQEFGELPTGTQLPSEIEITGGGTQVGEVGVQLSEPVTIRVLDVAGTPLPGVAVDWELLAQDDNGAVDGSVTTDASGSSTATWVLGETAGSQSVRVSVLGFDHVTATVTATAEPGPVTELTVDRDSLHFDALESSIALTTTAADRFGNNVPDPTVAWTSDASGIAQVTDGVVTSRANGTTRVDGSVDAAGVSVTVVVEQTPATVGIAESYRLTALGATTQAAASVADANGYDVPGMEVSWSSLDPGVVSVDGSGLLTAESVGTALVIASHNTLADTTEVAVVQELAAVSVSPVEDTVMVGGTAQFSAEARDANDALIPGASFTWTTLDPAIASVDAAGLATGLAEGTGRVMVASAGVSDTATVVVQQVTVDSLELSPESLFMDALGDTVRLTATAWDSTGAVISGASFSWSSSSTAVATVDASGLVTAVETGTTWVHVNAGTETDSAEIVVEQRPAAVAISPEAIQLSGAEDSTQVSAQVTDRNGNEMELTVTWAVEDTTVAVYRNGWVVSTAVGDTEITATHGSLTDTATLTVTEPVASLTVTPALDTVAIGGSAQFQAEARDVNGTPITGLEIQWASSDTMIASVDAGGLATGVNAGSVWVIASSGGVSDSATVVVDGGSSSFLGCDQVIDHTVGTVVDDTLTSADCVSVNRADSYARYYAFSLAGSEDLEIDMTAGFDTYLYLWDRDGTLIDQNDDGGDGVNSKLVLTLGPGDYVIEATSYQSATAGPFQLQTAVIQPPVAAVEVSPQADTLQAAGETTQFSATATDSSGATISGVPFTWSSSDTNVATVDADGLVTGQAAGSAWIVATAEGVSDSATVDVGSASPALHWQSQMGPPVTSSNLVDIWGSSSTDVYAVGSGGAIVHYNGLSWNTTAQAGHFAGIWGSSSNDVFAVGSTGAIAHYDGTAWRDMSSGTTERLTAVWGASGTDVFAVGYNGVIQTYDGTGWSSMVSGTTEYLYDVWGSSATDVIAVGRNGTILHYDGTSWSSMSSGTPLSLFAVWGTSSTDVWAAGATGTILHYDGTSWSSVATPTNEYLRAIWGESSTNLFAVGNHGTTLHYDGVSWSTLPSATTRGLNALWGSSATDVFAVGQEGLVQHYDGSFWTIQEWPMFFLGVWGTSPTNVFAVTNSGEIMHHDGASWGQVAGARASLYDIWGSSATDAYAVGTSGVIMHYDGNSWTSVSGASFTHMRGVWGSSSTDVHVVGATGTVQHYDGTAWTSTTIGSAWLHAVWGSSATDVFAVGDSGTILHYDGTGWTTMASGTSQSLVGVWGTSSTNVYAVGNGGTILHYDGTGWTSMASGTSASFRSVWGTSSTDVYAVGGSGTIQHYDGSGWTNHLTGPWFLMSVWGSAATDVWAVGLWNARLHGTP